MNWDEPAYSPPEYIPLNSCSELIPIRRYRVTAVERRATSCNLARPCFIHALVIRIFKALEKASRNFRPIVLGETEYLFEKGTGNFSHT